MFDYNVHESQQQIYEILESWGRGQGHTVKMCKTLYCLNSACTFTVVGYNYQVQDVLSLYSLPTYWTGFSIFIWNLGIRLYGEHEHVCVIGPLRHFVTL